MRLRRQISKIIRAALPGGQNMRTKEIPQITVNGNCFVLTHSRAQDLLRPEFCTAFRYESHEHSCLAWGSTHCFFSPYVQGSMFIFQELFCSLSLTFLRIPPHSLSSGKGLRASATAIRPHQ